MPILRGGEKKKMALFVGRKGQFCPFSREFVKKWWLLLTRIAAPYSYVEAELGKLGIQIYLIQ